jgi:hypothetical protein
MLCCAVLCFAMNLELVDPTTSIRPGSVTYDHLLQAGKDYCACPLLSQQHSPSVHENFKGREGNVPCQGSIVMSESLPDFRELALGIETGQGAPRKRGHAWLNGGVNFALPQQGH